MVCYAATPYNGVTINTNINICLNVDSDSADDWTNQAWSVSLAKLFMASTTSGSPRQRQQGIRDEQEN